MPPSRRTEHARLGAASLVGIALGLGIAACGGGASIGDACDTVSDCASDLQCLDHTCVPRCTRNTDCGDGHVCQTDGSCKLVDSSVGDACTREDDCAPGQSCQLLAEDFDGDGFLTAACQPENAGGVLDDSCTTDQQCRDGTCVLGRCVDICLTDDDCPSTHRCTSIPRALAADGVAEFYGCLPAQGEIDYQIPMNGVYERFQLPVPGNARSVALVASITDATQLVGAARVESPNGTLLYQLPFTRDEYFANRLRTEPLNGVSTLIIPQSPDDPLIAGAYVVELGSYRDLTTAGTEIPTVDALYKLDDTVHLGLHFYFLNLGDHPCTGDPDLTGTLDATSAQTSSPFHDVFLRQLSLIYANAGVVLDTNEATYEDIKNRPDLDGLDQSNLGDLLSLSDHDGGISIFFVRTISPSGLQGLVGGPPGTPGRMGTRASGIAIALDTLCYRDWNAVARDTAHEIARSLGLMRSVEPDGHEDPIGDSDSSSTNLMYFSEFGGTTLSSGQRAILRISPTLQ